MYYHILLKINDTCYLLYDSTEVYKFRNIDKDTNLGRKQSLSSNEMILAESMTFFFT